jgi:hypothetical protein
VQVASWVSSGGVAAAPTARGGPGRQSALFHGRRRAILWPLAHGSISSDAQFHDRQCEPGGPVSRLGPRAGVPNRFFTK